MSCTAERLQTNKAIFVCFYYALQMLSLLSLAVLYIGCTVVAVLSKTVAIFYCCSIKHFKMSRYKIGVTLFSQVLCEIKRPAATYKHTFIRFPHIPNFVLFSVWFNNADATKRGPHKWWFYQPTRVSHSYIIFLLDQSFSLPAYINLHL